MKYTTVLSVWFKNRKKLPFCVRRKNWYGSSCFLITEVYDCVDIETGRTRLMCGGYYIKDNKIKGSLHNLYTCYLPEWIRVPTVKIKPREEYESLADQCELSTMEISILKGVVLDNNLVPIRTKTTKK